MVEIKKGYFQDVNSKWWYEYGKIKSWGKKNRISAIIKNCKQCGKEFLTIPQRADGKSLKGNFCSRSCGHSATTIFWKLNKGKLAEKSRFWKGGRNKVGRGYIEIYAPNHPHTRGGKYVREHRLVMEKYLGRYLDPHEIVHHINGVKDDNRLANLTIVNNQNHHGEIQCPHCQKSFMIK